MCNTWTMRDGTVVAFKDMDINHLVNTINFLERKRKSYFLYTLKTANLVEADNTVNLIKYYNFLISEEGQNMNRWLSMDKRYFKLRKELDRRFREGALK